MPFTPNELVDIKAGLTADPRRISSYYFYDQAGSSFSQIMALPEYYLTEAERSILSEQTDDIVAALPAGDIALADLGSGDGTKTEYLLSALVAQGRRVLYLPIDGEAAALQAQAARLGKNLPGLVVQPLVTQYLDGLAKAKTLAGQRPLVTLLLGSNLGNFAPEQGLDFLMAIRAHLGQDDRLLLGVDLLKDPALLVPAYSDAAGVTARFNLNLLTRLNRELGADFDLACYQHYAWFDALTGAMRSALLSTKRQNVQLPGLDQRVDLEAWEPIHTEASYKFTLPQLTSYAYQAKFDSCSNFMDEKKLFVDIVLAPCQ